MRKVMGWLEIRYCFVADRKVFAASSADREEPDHLLSLHQWDEQHVVVMPFIHAEQPVAGILGMDVLAAEPDP